MSILYICKKTQIIEFNNIPSILNPQSTAFVLESFISSCDYKVKKLLYNFVSKEVLYELNKKHLNHHTDTDIITFDYSSGKRLEAEIFISPWAIDRSAKREGQTIEDETLRVLSHGVLHCMGHNDTTIVEKEQMRKLENQFIQMFHVKHRNHV
jgi:rRNA maturation RNase YbeY